MQENARMRSGLRVIGMFIGAAALLPAMHAANAQARQAAKPPLKQLACSYAPVGFFGLAKLMNQVENCVILANCRQREVETKELAGYTSPPWLWQGNANTATFTVAQENSFKADAKARAIAATPAGKQLIKLTFFTDILVPTGYTPGVLGVRATYAKCAPYYPTN